MSVQPVRIHIPLIVAANTSEQFVLEALLTTDFLLQPKLQFWNTSVIADVELDVTETLDFGASTDPLESGTYNNAYIIDQLHAAGAVADVPFGVSVLINTQSTPQVFHTITVTNPDLTDPITIRFLLTGMFDEVLRTNLNNFIRRDP